MASNRTVIPLMISIVIALGLVLFVRGPVDETPTYRYRLTVEVETPQGLRSGSSVIEVRTDVAGEYSIPTPGRVSTHVRGEAVAVDLPGGKTLFALLRSEESVGWAGAVMFNLTPRAPRTEAGDTFLHTFADMLKLEGAITLPRYWPKRREDTPAEPPRSAYPMLVTFADLSDATSVEPVDPNDLAASFGEGVRLNRITAEMTDAAVTSGIKARLMWADGFRKRHFDGSSIVSEDLTTNDLSAHLSAGSFSTEFAR